MEIPFIGGAYTGRSLPLNAQECQNWYPIIDQQDGRSVLAMAGTPGLKQLVDSGTPGEGRGAVVWDGNLFTVIGETLYKITANSDISNVGTLLTSTGRVYMAGGTNHLCITDGSYGYYRSSGETSLTKITDADFPVPSSLCYLDGFFVVTRYGTDEIYVSASEDASSWDGLDFASAEESPDDVLVAHTYKRHLIAFGERTIEVFYNSGDATYPFTRVAGAVIPVGIGAAGSAASGPEGLFFLDDQYQMRVFIGYETQVISTPQIDYQVRQYSKKSDAIGFTYTQDGHGFYVVTFPEADRTWVYDVTTSLWHTRSSGLNGGRHRANWHQWFSDKNIVGDDNNGKIYELDLSQYDDDGAVIESVRVAQVVQAARRPVFHSRIELDFEMGIGLNTGQGNDPQAMLSWSDDGGRTWSNEHWVSMGKIGEYKTRAIWRRLGRSRDRYYRLIITDPVKRYLYGAHLEAQQGNN